MPLILADGTNSDSANAYADLAYANAYHSLRKNAAWFPVSDPNKEAALIKATDFIESVYGASFLGYALAYTGLSWPRVIGQYDSDEIPDLLRKACCEFALQEITVGLHAPLSRDPLIKRKKTDVLEREYFAPSDNAVINQAAVGYLRGLVGGGSTGLNRQVIRV